MSLPREVFGADCIYLDARRGRSGPFSAPSDCDDYARWLRQRYDEAAYKSGAATLAFGVGQRINAVIAAARAGVPVSVFGEDAEAAADVIEAIANHDRASQHRIHLEVIA